MKLAEYVGRHLRGVPIDQARVMPTPGDPEGSSYVAARRSHPYHTPIVLAQQFIDLAIRLRAAGFFCHCVSISDPDYLVVQVEHPEDEPAIDCRCLVASVVKEVGLMSRG